MSEEFGWTPTRYVGSREPRESRLCPKCSSCWYVFENVSGVISAWHAGGCLGEDDGPAHRELPFEDAAKWDAPEGCPFAKEAQEAVREAGRNAIEEA